MPLANRAQEDPALIVDRAKSRGWVSGELSEQGKKLKRERKQKRGLNRYSDQTLDKQGHVLHVYAVWHWAKADAKDDFKTCKARVLSVGAPLPEVYELKSFWRFYKDQSRGRLDKRPTVQSLLTQAKALKAGLARLTKGKISDEDTEEINAWIKYVLPCEERSDVRDIVRPKFEIKPPDDSLGKLLSKRFKASLSSQLYACSAFKKTNTISPPNSCTSSLAGTSHDERDKATQERSRTSSSSHQRPPEIYQSDISFRHNTESPLFQDHSSAECSRNSVQDNPNFSPVNQSTQENELPTRIILGLPIESGSCVEETKHQPLSKKRRILQAPFLRKRRRRILRTPQSKYFLNKPLSQSSIGSLMEVQPSIQEAVSVRSPSEHFLRARAAPGRGNRIRGLHSRPSGRVHHRAADGRAAGRHS
ncbi:hypothetical protein B0J13DRAFT_563164 [Dactylonectria estremocensis]|uniref:Uncharacterized protein n=1 Tax=Dactylonectria estremocensis TaxID=1079267 RepID=A0A9P9ISL6_9HYPO|nr:hypothetical protein B0J13DRAFT_563164 [Dactylonectria estremocensis]